MARWLLAMLLAAQPVWGGELPRPDHIVIVIEENRSFDQIIGNADAPYVNELATHGALFTRSYGITHPSQPNYLALFSGTTRGITSDVCPLELGGPNLASALMGRSYSFATYSESLPEPGYAGCTYGAYMRKHNPVANWKELAAYNLPFSAFPSEYARLPTVALVVPNQLNDMHDGSIAQGDLWLEQNLGSYAQWAMTHNSLLIVTWDEDNGSSGNRIATIFVGQMVKQGRYAERIDHYAVLGTLAHLYGVPAPNDSAHAAPIRAVWR